jgi:hypothetical protein
MGEDRTVKTQTRRILCWQELIDARESHFARLEALYAGEPLEHTFLLWGYLGRGRADPYVEPERWVHEALDDLAERAELLRDRAVFRPLVIEPRLYGVHFIDRILGAEVFELTPGNWQNRLLETPIGRLEPPDLDLDETWALERRVAEAFLEAGVTVPVYSLPTLSAVQNTALNIYGDQLLLAMHADPEAVHHDFQVINDLICTLHRWYIERIPSRQLQPVLADERTQPPGFGQLCGCSSQLVSAEQYRSLIAPYDDALLSVYPQGGMIHLCGSHTQHLHVWRDMRSLRAVQVNDRAAHDLEVFIDALRDDQVLYVVPCRGMPLERIIEMTRGRRAVIVAEADEPLPARA